MMEPPTLIFYSMKSISVLRNITKEDIVYIDATGSILLGQQHCYVYEVVVRHHVEGNPPLAVASMIAWSHKIPSIANFLHRVWHARRICWDITQGRRQSSFVSEPFLHLCASHFMKMAKKLVRTTQVCLELF